ncbi:hypothetical protein F183_A49070 [Bryobacterales bacterium F-183]|nr:hypothetical protein F183_A49070 [Bryobacterales bacterium F-183]
MSFQPIVPPAGLATSATGDLFWKPNVAPDRQSTSFGTILANTIQEVQKAGNEAHEATASLLAGDGVDLHQVALKAQKAELSMEMFLQVRNKVVQAYQEIMRMQM